MEIEAYVLATQRSSPEFVLSNTSDISRLLYSQLQQGWIWQYLLTQACKISPSVIIASFPTDHELMNRVRRHFLTELRNSPHPCEAILHLKVLVALISRNSIRLTLENLNELYSSLEKLVLNPNKRLAEMIFYTVMIMLSLHDDYSSIVYLQSILGSIAVNAEGRRLLYALESREGKWGIILQEINEFFGFDIKMPEEFVERSAKIIIACRQGEKLEVEEMDDKCLAAYIAKGGKAVSIEPLVHSFKHSSDVHFLNLIENAVEKLKLHIPEHRLLEMISKHQNMLYRILLYVLLYNDKVAAQGYSFDFMFEIDVRKSLRQASKVILEKLLHLINEHLPWFFISSLSESLDSPAIPESFIFTFVHSLPNVSAQAVIDFKALLAYQPLKVVLNALDILEPLRTSRAQDLLNPLRVFSCISLQELKNIEVATSFLEVLLCAWQQYIIHYENSLLSLEYRNSFILTMQSACVQRLIDNLGHSEEVDNAICEFLHSYWIENFMLIKLVHTQGYPKKLLHITVNKIGSLICTWDFIMDLVQSGSSKQQRFALQLAGHLSSKYPTQRLLEILRSCIQFIEENLNLFSEDKSLEKTLDLYVKAFPTLNGRVKKLKRKFPKNFFSYETCSLQLVR